LTTIDSRLSIRKRLPVFVELSLVAAIFASFAWLADLFPYSGDDWAWGSQIGLDRLGTFFEDYNGRYAGNLAVLVLTRSTALVALVMAGTMAGIAFLVLHIARFRTITGYLLVYALLLAIPAAVWRQGVVWTSGFSNYTLSTLSMLAVVAATRRLLSAAPTDGWRSLAHGTGIFLLTFVGQLFVEHVTILILVFAGCSVVYAKYANGRISGPIWSLFAGSALGAVAMFSNGAYLRALGGDATYQKIGQAPGGRIDQMVGAFNTVIGPYGVTLNVALNVTLLSLLTIAALGRWGRSEKRRGTHSFLWALVGVAACAGAVLVAVRLPRDVAELQGAGFVGPLVLALVVGTCAAVVRERRARTLLILILGALIVLTAPLLVVKPIGPRNFVPTYALLLIAVAVLARHVSRVMGSRGLWTISVAAAVLAVPTYAARFSVYSEIDHASAVRQARVKIAVDEGRDSVTVKPLPEGRTWLHVPDPGVEPWNTRYKLFYGVPESLTVKVK
jgi:hypothetical protein